MARDDMHRQEVLASVYSRPDPSTALGELEALFEPADAPSPEPTEVPPDKPDTADHELGKRFLGADTTGLEVTPRLEMDVIPTAIYNLLSPDDEPLVSVAIRNVSMDARAKRVRVRSWIEALSAEAVRTVEIERDDSATVRLLPALLPERAERITEVRRVTVHVQVDDLDGAPELHATYLATCLSRNASFNGVRRPADGQRIDLSHYYGAWVTPHAEAVQERVRHAAQYVTDGRIFGYQKQSTQAVAEQVAALYRSLADADIAYVSSIIDYGNPPGMTTQRTRLPRESLARKSANCIDATVLMASLLEGAALEAAIVLVPGHAIVAWKTARGDDGTWRHLEATMIGHHGFEAACQAGDRLANFHEQHGKIVRHELRELRERGIWPME